LRAAAPCPASPAPQRGPARACACSSPASRDPKLLEPELGCCPSCVSSACELVGHFQNLPYVPLQGEVGVHRGRFSIAIDQYVPRDRR
jgi:hypothetical protein